MSVGTPSWIPALQVSAAIAGPLIVAVVAGAISYSVWRKQQLAKQKHDLALKAVHHLILLREEFWRARSMLMDSDEVEVYRKELNHEPIEYDRHSKEQYQAFRRVGHTGRYNRLSKSYLEVHTVFYEVEALLGGNFRESLKPVWKHIVEYRIAVEMILDSDSLRELPKDEVMDYRSKVHGDIDLESDAFGHKFEGLIETLTNRMRSYLITK